MEITETFEPKSRFDWRKWLSKNHTKKEIWLVIYKKSTGKQAVSINEAVDEALCFGWIDGIEKGLDSMRYALRFTPRSKVSRWSSYNIKRYKELLKDGLVEEPGKLAYKNHGPIYTIHNMTKEGVLWHQKNKMPKNPTLQERLAWHREHQKHCGCREIPKSLEQYFK